MPCQKTVFLWEIKLLFMDYTELRVSTGPGQEKRDIIMALLAEVGFESFTDEGDFLLAYIPQHEFNTDVIEGIFGRLPDSLKFKYSYKQIPAKNWNAEWEKNYSPVLIDNRVSIRAPFHKSFKTAEYEIIIEPKMSFGTAHHPTTAQIIKLMLHEDFKEKTVLDMGCGTSVLAILASMLGAKHIDAIDNDDWAYNNSAENVERNKIPNISLYFNDATFLDSSKEDYYDLIIANINRNILLNDLPVYAKSLKKDAVIFMSGFYKNDLKLLNNKAKKNGLMFDYQISSQNWVAAKWTKN